jgi:hypothetical protein
MADLPPMEPSATERVFDVLINKTHNGEIIAGINTVELLQEIKAVVVGAYRDGFLTALSLLREPSEELVKAVKSALVEAIEESPHNFGEQGIAATYVDASRAALRAAAEALATATPR